MKCNVHNFIGVICRLERQFGRALHWCVCLLHFNELPLRHLFVHLDGETKGPKAYTGEIGVLLVECEKRPIRNFKKIVSDDMPVFLNFTDLSVDQRYLYELVHAIQTGKVSDKLKNQKPGPLNHSRFLTLASRILRLYVSYSQPSKNLRILASFVVKVYAPFWFTIKSQSNFADGARHLFLFTQLISYLPTDLKEVVVKVVDNNSYFLHKENILVSMLTDEQQDIRQAAVDIIMRGRQSSNQPDKIRTFEKPDIDYGARHYTEVVSIDVNDGIEPPIAKILSESDLKLCIEEKDNVVSKMLESIPNHTQAVERLIRVVSQSSKKISDEKKRNEAIVVKLQCRKVLKNVETKKDFVDFVNAN